MYHSQLDKPKEPIRNRSTLVKAISCFVRSNNICMISYQQTTAVKVCKNGNMEMQISCVRTSNIKRFIKNEQ